MADEVELGVWGLFLEISETFGRISGDIILFVSSKRMRLRARNFAVILIFIPLTTCEKISFTEYTGGSFTNGFSGPKSFWDFGETGPWNEYRTGGYSGTGLGITGFQI